MHITYFQKIDVDPDHTLDAIGQFGAGDGGIFVDVEDVNDDFFRGISES